MAPGGRSAAAGGARHDRAPGAGWSTSEVAALGSALAVIGVVVGVGIFAKFGGALTTAMPSRAWTPGEDAAEADRPRRRQDGAGPAPVEGLAANAPLLRSQDRIETQVTTGFVSSHR